MTKEKIIEVIKMRQEGYSFSSIGRYFDKDHTTIMYHCQKAIVYVKTDITKVLIKPLKRDYEYLDTLEIIEVTNSGKSYSQYLEDEKKRKWKNRKDIAIS